ncbi:cytochrome P450 [Amycolatopsis sp. NPDC088138]|uniref:cytochrome P450 family protein n=1 Tax=Amycolatopsis sp. NPDC088138 TaxID=3363938 RepID=UPI00380FF663
MSEPLPTEFILKPGPDPHPANAELRSRCPVHKVDYPAGAEAYLVMDYEHVNSAFSDPRLSKRVDNAPGWYRERALANSPVMTRNLLVSDPPEHTRLRKLVSRAFLPRRIEALRPRIQEITDDLIDSLPESGEVDLMDAFAIPLPLTVICESLGVPFADRPLFEAWGRVLSQSPNQLGDADRRRKEVNDEVDEYFGRTLRERRAALGDDLMSDLIRTADADGRYTPEELITTTTFLIIAGHKTTANLIGNGTVLLLTHKEQFDLLRSDPGLVETAVEEFLRYEGSVDRASLRVTTEDVRLGGVDIPKQSFVHLSVCSADRDPAVFEDPDRFDITRTPNHHMAFGFGAHFCPGAPLARLEGQVAFPTLLRRLRGLELTVAPEELAWLEDSSTSRGVETLPVRFEKKLPR